MPTQVHFFHSHVHFFPENLGALSNEQGGKFHQDINTVDSRYEICWYDNMIVDHFWMLNHDNPGKICKDRFHIGRI